MITIKLTEWEAIHLITACNYLYITHTDVLDEDEREAAYRINDRVDNLKNKIKEGFINETTEN